MQIRPADEHTGVSMLDPIAVERRLTLLESRIEYHFKLVAMKQDGLARQLDKITEHIQKQNGRLDELDTWRDKISLQNAYATGERVGSSRLQSKQVAILLGAVAVTSSLLSAIGSILGRIL